MAKAKDTKGLFIGKPHSKGGIPSEIVETGKQIEIEGDEYYICREAYHSDEVLEFKQKTNKEILDYIYTEYTCKLVQDKMKVGDFIVCKIVVKDNLKHDRKGTISEILNEMQGEKSCKVENESQYFKDGGFVCPVGTKIQTLIFHKSIFNTKEDVESWVKEHDFTLEKIGQNKTSFRVRQHEPSDFTDDTFRTIALTNGIKAVIGCPKDSFEEGSKISNKKDYSMSSDWFSGYLSFLNW